MSYYVKIEFFDRESPDEVFTLYWKVLDYDHCLVWVKMLSNLLRNKNFFYGRFTGFLQNYKNLNYLSNELNKCIEVINAEKKYYIPERAHGDFSQDFANKIHHHFEILYGEAHNQSNIFKTSSSVVQSAITKLNHHIHDMESLSRNQSSSSKSSAGLITEFLFRPKIKMPEHFFDHFTFDIEFGDIVAHYGLVGKTWWEVFVDSDEEVFPEAIRPLNVLSGEFDIYFGQFNLTDNLKSDFYNFLKNNNQDPFDKSLALGHLRLAELLKPDSMTNDQIKKELSRYSQVKSISLLRGMDDVMSELDLSESDTARDGFFQILTPQALRPGQQIKLKDVPVQLIPVCSEHGVVEIAYAPFEAKMEGLGRGYSVTLMGTSDDNPLRVLPSQVPQGLFIERDYLLSKNRMLSLLYDRWGRYYEESSLKRF